MAGPYRRAMDALYPACVIVGVPALVLISAVIPRAVFTRYVLNGAASWPEAIAVLLCWCHQAITPSLHALATGGRISISALFMAGVFPGPLLGFPLILLCIVIAYREGHPHGQRVLAKDSVVGPPPPRNPARGRRDTAIIG